VIQANESLPTPMTFADLLINLGWGDAGAVTGRVVAWRNLFDLLKPDLLRCAYALGALLVARGAGIRTVAMGLGFMVPPNVHPLPLWRGWPKNYSLERMAERERRVLDGMNRGLDAIGAPRLTSVGALYAEAGVREIYSYPELDNYGPRGDVQYLGNFQTGLGAPPPGPPRPASASSPTSRPTNPHRSCWRPWQPPASRCWCTCPVLRPSCSSATSPAT